LVNDCLIAGDRRERRIKKRKDIKIEEKVLSKHGLTYTPILF
jgi:hypothetical protein